MVTRDFYLHQWFSNWKWSCVVLVSWESQDALWTLVPRCHVPLDRSFIPQVQYLLKPQQPSSGITLFSPVCILPSNSISFKGSADKIVFRYYCNNKSKNLSDTLVRLLYSHLRIKESQAIITCNDRSKFYLIATCIIFLFISPSYSNQESIHIYTFNVYIQQHEELLLPGP